MKLCYPIEGPGCNCALMAARGDFEANLRALKAIGYEAVELIVRNAEECAAADRTLEKLQISVCAVSTAAISKQDGLTLLHPDSIKRAEAMERIAQLLDYCAKWHCPLLIGKVRGDIKKIPIGGIEGLTRCMKDICSKAEILQVPVLIEPQNITNIDNINTLEEAALLIEAVDSPMLGIHADTYHMDIAESDPAEALRRYCRQVGFVHISDSDRLQPGDGHIDISQFLQILSEIGYDAYLSPEIKQMPDSLSCAEMYYKKMQQYL